MDKFDVAVIGGGPGGYVAAIRLVQLGKKVVLIERDELGGICLNWGCIPTKALLRSAEVFRNAQEAEKFGVTVSGLKFDIKKIVERSRTVSKQLTGGIKSLMKKNKIKVIKATAELAGSGIIKLTGSETGQIKADKTIIATGARARQLPGYEADGEKVWTYREAMVPSALPKSIVIVGSGAIGIEFASFYSMLGAEVTVLEVQKRILQAEDEEIANHAQRAFEAQGIKFHTGIKLESASKNKNGVEVKFNKGNTQHSVTSEKLIMAVGVVPNTENLGLEKTKVKQDKAYIKTNGFMQTDDPNIYAIGDVTEGPWLAHKASHEGIIAAEHIAGLKPHPMDKSNIAGCTYSMPQIASVGMTEEQAKGKGLKIKVGRFPFMGNGKAIALGDSEGLIKTIFDENTGELLGAHMVGAEVTELIQGYCIAKSSECTEQEIMHTIFPHPTLSEMMHESVLDAYGRALHI